MRNPPTNGDRRRRVTTIRDVARLAGVSIATVSKALNGGGQLRPETRRMVMQVAGEIGYHANHFAQSLHRDRSMTVGIISSDSFGRFTLPIVEALESELAEHGIAIFMCNATDDPERERQHVEQLIGKRVDGLVVTARRADLRQPITSLSNGLPVVYVYTQADDPNALSLVPDDEGGAEMAVKHLLELGRRRIAHVTGPESFEAVRLRRLGYFRALASAGLAPISEFCLAGAWSEAWGREAIATLFDGPSNTPDAIFAGNDQIARGAVEALRERGMAVPGDVAIVGFDNWEVMTLSSRPPLSSIDMQLRHLGHQAGRQLLDKINGATVSGVRRLPCTLVVRESSAGIQKEQVIPA